MNFLRAGFPFWPLASKGFYEPIANLETPQKCVSTSRWPLHLKTHLIYDFDFYEPDPPPSEFEFFCDLILFLFSTSRSPPHRHFVRGGCLKQFRPTDVCAGFSTSRPRLQVTSASNSTSRPQFYALWTCHGFHNFQPTWNSIHGRCGASGLIFLKPAHSDNAITGGRHVLSVPKHKKTVLKIKCPT